MPKYQCPECEAILKREMPIPEGKKVRCPKCESLFRAVPISDDSAPKAEPKKAKAVKAVKKSEPTDDDEEVGGSYGVAEEKEETDKEKKKKAVNYGSLRDKYEKSKRGPAMAKVTKLSNGLLLVGIICFLLSLFGVIYGLWPFVFSENMPRGAAAHYRIGYIAGSIFGGVWGGCICFGGSKMHELESFGWAMAAAILSTIYGALNLIAGLIGVIQISGVEFEDGMVKMLIILILLVQLALGALATTIGVKSIMRLKDEEVKEGFEETQNKVDY